MNDRALDKVQGLLTDVIFGPVTSRRYGCSLGVNLLPARLKVCNFNCPYCECGWTQVLDLSETTARVPFPTCGEVALALETALFELRHAGRQLDAITFAGNGEPSMHPQFLETVQEARQLRDQLAPEARLVLLSNSATLGDPRVREALTLFDERVMKLDAGRPEDFAAVNLPHRSHTLERIIADLAELARELPITLQSLFIAGRTSNAGEASVAAWIAAVAQVRPRAVQVYSIERPPAASHVQPLPAAQLAAIARRLTRETGIPTEVY